ncbi:MAG: phosphatidylserine/phosphatidylglycerophosphate/cardiolipin synthase family protein [Candidatus Sericytochromatia bacterium]|nr:phosphatidylserine/phosphatidylglycerophosphate/cardiolipin synthase family protein [Candidatus Sericytochromatia bacterium]
MLSGNHVSALVDPAAIFAAITAEIGRAEHQILLDIFLFGGTTGHDLADHLCARVAAGVEVKILFDPHLGGPILRPLHEPVLRRLQLAGAVVRPFAIRKLPGWWRPLKADHNKVLVVDGRHAFVGGANFHDGSQRNHDLMLLLRGPAATYLGEIFARHWSLAGGTQPARMLRFPDEGPSLVRVTVSNPDRQDIRQYLLTALAEVREDILLSMYVLGDNEVERALVAAHRRGVKVRIILDPNIQAFSLPINGMPNVAAVMTLRPAGLPIRFFPVKPGGQMHLKLAIFDHNLVVTGSANWTTLGLDGNNETTLFIEDIALATELAELFERDWLVAVEPLPLTWKDRLAGWLIRMMRRCY